MPIRPEMKALYPKNWRELSRQIREERAGNRCEHCGAENHLPHPETESSVVLTVAHLNHDPTDNRPENLAALCQRCHLNYDRARHQQRRRETLRRRRACGSLFEEER